MTLSTIAEFPQGLAFVTDTRVTRVELAPETAPSPMLTYEENSHKISKLTDWAGIVTAGDKALADLSVRTVRRIIAEQPARGVTELLGILTSVCAAEFSADHHVRTEFLVGSRELDVFKIHYLCSPSFGPMLRSDYDHIGYITPKIADSVRVGYELARGASNWPIATDPFYLATIFSRPFNDPSLLSEVPQIGEYLVIAGLDQSSFRYHTLEVRKRNGSRHYLTKPLPHGAVVVDFVRERIWPVPDLMDPHIFTPKSGTELDLDNFHGALRILGIQPRLPRLGSATQ